MKIFKISRFSQNHSLIFKFNFDVCNSDTMGQRDDVQKINEDHWFVEDRDNKLIKVYYLHTCPHAP